MCCEMRGYLTWLVGPSPRSGATVSPTETQWKAGELFLEFTYGLTDKSLSMDLFPESLATQDPWMCN